MVKLIKLHKWVGNRMSPAAAASNGSPVWVNPSMITQMGQYEGVVIAPDGPLTYADRPKELVTSISFPAAMPEEVDGVSVIETPDEIIALIAVSEAPTLLDTLILALPYVESEEENPAYDDGVVTKVIKQMRSAIARAEGREG